MSSRFPKNSGLLPSLLLPLLCTAAAQAANITLLPTEDYQVRISTGPASNPANLTMQASAVAATNTFFFAYLKFDVGALTPGEPKTLSLTPTGPTAAALRLVVLGAPIADTDGTADGDFRDIPTANNAENNALRRAWFDTNVAGQSLVTLYELSGVTTMDVTAAVDAWINGTVPNYGFALFTTAADAREGNSSNGVFTSEYADPDTPGSAAFRPTLTQVQVPEPGATSLAALTGLALLGRRRRR